MWFQSLSGTSCNTAAFTCEWQTKSGTGCCEVIDCVIPPACAITCDYGMANSTDLNHCIIELSNVLNMKQIYIVNITFANISSSCHCSYSGQELCSCSDNYHFSPIDCSLMRPTQTTQVQTTLSPITKVQATTTTATTTVFTTTTTTVTNTSIATIVAPAITVTTLLCISIATGSALLCALCMKKRKQDLTTLHSDSKDQQKYNA